jgi:hypothetical protein
MRRRLVFAFVFACLIAVGLTLLLSGEEDERSGPSTVGRSPTAKKPIATTADARVGGRATGPIVGISDNRPETLRDKRFLASGIKRARVLVPYDEVARGADQLHERAGGSLRALDAWFALAQQRDIEPLVSFYRSARSIHRLPSVASYRAHFRRFRARYPWVELFTTWNEANFASGQPTGRDPVRTARFYRTLREECAGGKCTVLVADFRADGNAHSARWLRTFKRHIGPGPHIWGLVPHPDVNRLSTARTRWFLRNTRGPVWATEVGAVNFFGRRFRPGIAKQARAAHFMMFRYPRVSARLKRMYVYHWRAARGNRLWDSALLSASGTRRPAYYVFFRGLGKRAP